MSHLPKALLPILIVAAVLSIGAKCVENTSLRRGTHDGDWHIYGELHNETDIQGVQMAVIGTLLDAAGSVIATAEIPICPIELSPHSVSVFDIDFNGTQDMPRPASYKVNVLRGKVIEQALPPLNASITKVTASRSGDEITLSATVALTAAYPGNFYACMAFYDANGTVVEQVSITGGRTLEANATKTLEYFVDQITTDATGVRFWLIGPGNVPLESNYQAIASDMVEIQ